MKLAMNTNYVINVLDYISMLCFLMAMIFLKTGIVCYSNFGSIYASKAIQTHRL